MLHEQAHEGCLSQGTRQPASRGLSGNLLSQQPEVVTEKVGSYKAGVSKISNADDAAQLAHHFTKDPQENFVAILTGEDGKLIAVHRYSRGTYNAALANPAAHIIGTTARPSFVAPDGFFQG